MTLRPIILAENGINIPRTTKVPTCSDLRRQIVEAERNLDASHYMLSTNDPGKFRDQSRLDLSQAILDYGRLSCSDLMLDMSRLRQRLVSSVMK